MSNFLAEASEIQGDLVAIRRHIHQEPEIGLDLPKTQAKILAALDGLGLEITTGKAPLLSELAVRSLHEMV
jgi:hippurate hydrolase